MTEHTTTRPQSFDEPAFAPLRRTDLAAFVVTLADSRILAVTPPCEQLGLHSDTPAPLSVKAVTRAMGNALGHPPRLERIRLPNAYVPRLFSCATLPSSLGPVVLFADPASISHAPEEPPPTREPQPPAAEQRPVRFSWEMDSDGRVTTVSASLVAHIPGASGWCGSTLAELEQDGVLHGTDAATAALEAGATFANVAFRSGDPSARRIEIGGVPLFDAMRRRVGWRGFGMVWPEQASGAATPVSRHVPNAFAPNVVPLRGGNLSARERSAFDEIARTLSDAIEGWPRAEEAGEASARTPDAPQAAQPAPAPPPQTAHPAAPPPAPEAPTADQGLSWDDRLLDRLPIGIAVQQDGAVIFLNETLLAWLALEDVAAFNRAGGFGVLLTREKPDAPLHLRTLSGESPVDVRLIRASWRGQPAVIHVLRLTEEAASLPRTVEGAHEPAIPLALDLFAFPLVVLNEAGAMVQANQAASQLCGFPVDELVGEPFTVLFASESQTEAVALLDAALKGKTDTAPALLTGRHRNGDRLSLEATVSRPTGSPPVICLALRAVSAPHSREQAASAAPSSATSLGPEVAPPPEDALGNFARRVSHGVRSPLNGILGFVESVRASTFGPVGNSRYSRQAEAAALAAQQLLATLEDIEALARSSAAEAVHTVALGAVVSSAIQHLTPSMKRRRQIIRSDVADDLAARINGDILAFLVRSVLEEAIRATPGGGQIMVSASWTPMDGLCLLIRDSGPALSEPQISQALSPFLPATASDRFSSSGRPFRIARLAAVLKANGGELRLRRGVDTGMLCELVLPV